MKKSSIFDIILNIIIILLAILIIYWLVKLIFGGSPDFDEFNFALIMLISGFLIKTYREVGEIKVTIKHNFIRMREDINSIKENINLMSENINSMKKRKL